MEDKDSNEFQFQSSIESFTNKVKNGIDFRKTIRIRNKQEKSIIGNPHPFLKWAGGKRQLIPQIDQYLPKDFNKYIEPFVGGGALFFYLLPKKAILIDINSDLINVYRILKEDVRGLVNSLKKHKNDKEYYYKVRKLDRNLEDFNNMSKIERASRIIFLNRCCYNGLYRVNSKGQFNVPFGKYKNPTICDDENLMLVSKVLKEVKIVNDSFEICLEYANEDDLIYLDPPYVPISESSSFTSYTKNDFGKEDQIRLNDVFRKLDKRGCKVLLSNSYNDFILELYEDFKINILHAKRAINSDPDKRGEIREVLITNDFS